MCSGLASIFIKKREVMNEEILKEVLEDVLQEFKEANQKLGALEGRVAAFEQKLIDQQVIVEAPDLRPAFDLLKQQSDESAAAVTTAMEAVQQAVKESLQKLEQATSQERADLQKVSETGLQAIADRLAQQPKPIIRQFRFSLFPENDREGHYKYFIKWVFGGTLLVMVIGALFFLGRQYLSEVVRAAPTNDVAAEARTFFNRRVDSFVRKPERRRGDVGRSLTSQDARKRVDSMLRAEKIKKIEDTLYNILMQRYSASLRSK